MNSRWHYLQQRGFDLESRKSALLNLSICDEQAKNEEDSKTKGFRKNERKKHALLIYIHTRIT